MLLVLLVGATAMVSIFAWTGRLTNPFMLILLPAMTLVAAALALLTRANSPLLPVVCSSDGILGCCADAHGNRTDDPFFNPLSRPFLIIPNLRTPERAGEVEA